jgi:hypothetical protein
VKAAAPARDFPARHEDRPHTVASVAVRERSRGLRGTRPARIHGSTARHHREKGNVVLTNGQWGPGGEGVGEEVRDTETRKAAALVGEIERRRGEGEAEEVGGRRRAWLLWVRLLLAGGSGFAAGGAAPGASVLLLLSPFSSSGLRVCGQGIESPEAARVGRALGVAAATSYSGEQRGGTWTVGMCRMAVGRIAMAAMTGAAALWRRRQPKR